MQSTQSTHTSKKYIIPWHGRIQFRVGLIVIATLVVVLGTLGYLDYSQTRKEVHVRLMDTADRVASRLS